MSTTGRTSTEYAAGSSVAASTAASRSGRSTSQKPPSCSTVSAYGPSVTARSGPGRTVRPLSGRSRASPASTLPRALTASVKAVNWSNTCCCSASERAPHRSQVSSSAISTKNFTGSHALAGAYLDQAFALAEDPAGVDDLVDARGLDQVEAGQLLDRLGVRAVGDRLLPVGAGPQGLGLARVGELGAAGDAQPALLEELRELAVLLV